MRASVRFTGKSILLSLTAILWVLYGCAPRPIAEATPLIPQTGPIESEPTAEATEVESVEPTDTPLQIALTAVSFTAKVFKNGDTETDVEEDQKVSVEANDRIEVVKLENQEKQSRSILDFSDFLTVELFTNAVVLLQDVREEAGGSTHVTLNLSRGHMFVELTDETNSRVTVETPDATINTLEDGTQFRICKAPDSLTCAQVKKGSIEIIAKGEKEIVKAGEASFIFKDEPPSSIICAPNEIFVDWEEQYRQETSTPTLGAMVAGLRELCSWQSPDLPPDALNVYQDQFTDPTSGWLQEKVDNYFIGYSTPQYYHVQIQSPGEKAVVYLPDQEQYDDVNIDVEAQTGNAKSGDFHYGLVFRRNGDQYYAFAISPSTKSWYVLKSSSEGEETLKEGTNEGIQGMDAEDMLRVVSKGPVFTFYINGQLIYQLLDADYAKGEVGLFVQTVDSPSALIYFDSLTLWTMPEQTQAPVPVANSTPLTKENCFNNRDDDGDHFVDRDDPDCNRPDVAPTLAPVPGSNTEPALAGCTDSKASNFNPSATVDDGSCKYDIRGCTDSNANNFDPNATVDDGSCTYDVRGCTDSNANNFDPNATVDDGSCTYDVRGCTDPSANNFDPNATVDDGSCTYDPETIPGCTDPNATNYNPNATEDDGSCTYE